MWGEREPPASSRILQGLGLSRKMGRRGHSNGDRFGSVRARVPIVSIASLRPKRSTKKSNFFIFQHWDRYQCWKIKMATSNIKTLWALFHPHPCRLASASSPRRRHQRCRYSMLRSGIRMGKHVVAMSIIGNTQTTPHR